MNKENPGYIDKKVKMQVQIIQSCPILCNPVDYTVHEILQATILEWIAFPFFGGSSHPRDWIQVSFMAGGCFTTEPPGKPLMSFLLFKEHCISPISFFPPSPPNVWKCISPFGLPLSSTEAIYFKNIPLIQKYFVVPFLWFMLLTAQKFSR